MSNREPSLEWMEPPGDGLRTLREKIVRRNRTRIVAAGFAGLALMIGTLIQDWRTTTGTSPAPNAMIARHTVNDTDVRPPLRVINGAALELPSPSSNAGIYLVSTMPDETVGKSR